MVETFWQKMAGMVSGQKLRPHILNRKQSRESELEVA